VTNRILCKIANVWHPVGVHRDQRGAIRVVSDQVSYDRLVQRSFEKVRQAGAGMPAVMIRQLDALAKIMEQTSDAGQSRVLIEQAAMIHRSCVATVPEESDRADVERRYEALLAPHGDRARVESCEVTNNHRGAAVTHRPGSPTPRYPFHPARHDTGAVKTKSGLPDIVSRVRQRRCPCAVTGRGLALVALSTMFPWNVPGLPVQCRLPAAAGALGFGGYLVAAAAISLSHNGSVVGAALMGWWTTVPGALWIGVMGWFFYSGFVTHVHGQLGIVGVSDAVVALTLIVAAVAAAGARPWIPRRRARRGQ
jgi:Predicted membrane protein (DUF2254)